MSDTEQGWAINRSFQLQLGMGFDQGTRIEDRRAIRSRDRAKGCVNWYLIESDFWSHDCLATFQFHVCLFSHFFLRAYTFHCNFSIYKSWCAKRLPFLMLPVPVHRLSYFFRFEMIVLLYLVHGKVAIFSQFSHQNLAIFRHFWCLENAISWRASPIQHI